MACQSLVHTPGDAACSKADRCSGSAEDQTLLAFRQVSGRFELCKYILQASFPHCQGACFQAACTLREMIQKEWSTVPESEMVQLRDSLVQFVIGHVDKMENYLTNAIAFIVACMLKRFRVANGVMSQLSCEWCTGSGLAVHSSSISSSSS